MKFINLNKHGITLADATGNVLQEFPADVPQELAAKVDPLEKDAPPMGSIPCITRAWGDVQNLPEPKEGVVYIVNSVVLAQVPHRDDVVAPDTGSTAHRNDKGQVVAVTRFVRN